MDEENEDICKFCLGTGEIDIPAENRGGQIYGPDIKKCPCQLSDWQDNEEE